ncbi:hypothetical protein E2C01_007097 [Portunus trituberculatus]|uniref:Uncharacterized protein n=1 Tax=Portunus trituberculatus TaxID=210409 RepID=A0A5B7D3K9_PORTR|nr:hypothetical protein [Portunus trituberculatus]
MVTDCGVSGEGSDAGCLSSPAELVLHVVMEVKEAEAKCLTQVVDTHVGFQQHESHAVLHKLNLPPRSTPPPPAGEPQPCKEKTHPLPPHSVTEV